MNKFKTPPPKQMSRRVKSDFWVRCFFVSCTSGKKKIVTEEVRVTKIGVRCVWDLVAWPFAAVNQTCLLNIGQFF